MIFQESHFISNNVFPSARLSRSKSFCPTEVKFYPAHLFVERRIIWKLVTIDSVFDILSLMLTFRSKLKLSDSSVLIHHDIPFWPWGFIRQKMNNSNKETFLLHMKLLYKGKIKKTLKLKKWNSAFGPQSRHIWFEIRMLGNGVEVEETHLFATTTTAHHTMDGQIDWQTTGGCKITWIKRGIHFAY